MGMLPAIVRTAEISFRKVRPELRKEFIQEVIANSLVAYARLVELGKETRHSRPLWSALRWRIPVPVAASAADYASAKFCRDAQ